MTNIGLTIKPLIDQLGKERDEIELVGTVVETRCTVYWWLWDWRYRLLTLSEKYHSIHSPPFR